MRTITLFTAITLFFSLSVSAQFDGVDPFQAEDDDLNIGGDIFSDFNEDIESAQIAEDERFYRYGRLFSIQFGVGVTTFTGNRGEAYVDRVPSLMLSYNYFQNFRNSFGLGIAYSKHTYFLGQGSQYRGFRNVAVEIGDVNVNMIRAFFHYRYYIDTADLGTAITYSNPYFTGRMEFWYVSNKFDAENDDGAEIADQSAGNFGFGVGGGFDFPIELRESYINVEFLMHFVPYDDSNTVNFQCIDPSNCAGPAYDDFKGNALTTTVSYVINW